MSAFPGSPRLLRGGLVLVDPGSAAVRRIIALQYNPDTITRSFQVKGAGADTGSHSEALRLAGPPVETVKLEAEIDVTDQLEHGDAQAMASGLHASIAALELMIYPATAHLSATNARAAGGQIEILQESAPLPLFVFGRKRIVPVRITELSITEEAFDPDLSPIRAKVSLGMRVLTVDDLGFGAAGGLFMTYLQVKERFAASLGPGSFAPLGIAGVGG